MAEKVLQCNADILAQKLPNFDDLVNMATVINKKALHEFLLFKCKGQTIELTKRFKLRDNNRLKAELMLVINEVGSSEEILDIESRIKELVDEDVVNALKNRKSTTFLRMRGQVRGS